MCGRKIPIRRGNALDAILAAILPAGFPNIARAQD